MIGSLFYIEREGKIHLNILEAIHIYLSLYCKRVRKGLLKVCVWEGAGDRTELKYFDPHSYGRQCCVFLVLPMFNRRPWAYSAGWSATSYQQLLRSLNSIGVPKAPSAWCGFPYHISSITPFPTGWNSNSVLTELYNSSTSTRSPTRSLKSHVWSSSSGNNCHAVHRSLSSGASVYECTVGIFYLVLFHQPISAHAISSHNCH